MEPLGEHCQNNWCKLKAMIRGEFPELTELPLFDRIKIKFSGYESEHTRSWAQGTTFISQTWVTVRYNGKEYFKRWGRLFK